MKILALLLIAGTLAAENVAFFGSHLEIVKELIARIDSEKERIALASSHLTHKGVEEALLKAKKRGVDIEVIVDRVSVKPKLAVYSLVDAGIPVHVYTHPEKKGSHMHHRFCLFGKNHVWTSGVTLTNKKSTQHRSSSLVLDHKEVLGKYEEEFAHIKQVAAKKLTTLTGK